jgi:hypothetical protein
MCLLVPIEVSRGSAAFPSLHLNIHGYVGRLPPKPSWWVASFMGPLCQYEAYPALEDPSTCGQLMQVELQVDTRPLNLVCYNSKIDAGPLCVTCLGL